MRLKHPISILLAAILLATTASASWTASIQAPTVEINDGFAEGTLVASRYETVDVPSDWSTWSLTGASLDVYTWNLESNFSAGTPVFDAPYESHNRHGAFEGAIDDIRFSGSMSVVSNANASLNHSNSHIALSPSQHAVFTDAAAGTGTIDNPRNKDVIVENTTHLAPATKWGQVTVTGDFHIRINEIDWEIQDENGTHLYKSGREETPAHQSQPDPPIGHVGKTHVRDTYLYVTNGTLTIQALTEGEFEYFIEDWSAQSPQGLEFRNSDGFILGDREREDLENNTVFFPGPVELTNGLVDNGVLSFAAETTSNTVYVDGIEYSNPPEIIEPPIQEQESPAPETITTKKWGPNWWILTSTTIAILGIALAGIQFQKPFWYVRWKMRRGKHEYVIKETPRFFRKTRKRKKSILMHALALLGRGKFEDATDFVFSLLPRDRPDEATWNYLAAMALAGNGEFQDAKNHLRRCLSAAPQYLPEIQQNPLLIRLLAENHESGSEYV